MKTLASILVAVMTLASLPSAEAAGSSRSAASHHAGTVVGVSPSKLLVREGRSTMTYSVTSATSVRINGRPAKVTMIRQGMRATITTSNGVADSITATTPRKHRGRR